MTSMTIVAIASNGIGNILVLNDDCHAALVKYVKHQDIYGLIQDSRRAYVCVSSTGLKSTRPAITSSFTT